MEVLHSYTSVSNVFSILGIVSISVILLLVTFVTGMNKKSAWFVRIVAFMLLICSFPMAMNPTEELMKVKINDGQKLDEEKYELVSQEGKILTIKERK